LQWHDFFEEAVNFIIKSTVMQNWLRTILAGAAAWKWGGGCVGTILLFLLFYWLLGHC
jgi:hypothetical protein